MRTAASITKNQKEARERYRQKHPQARKNRCSRCRKRGHNAKTCTYPSKEGITVEGLVIRILCPCGRRFAGTVTLTEALEILEQHKQEHVEKRRART